MIAHSRNLIHQAIQHLSARLNFSTTTLEYDLNERCTVFVDVECSGTGINCREMEITGIELTKDGVCSDNSYPNIADFMGRKLDAVVNEMNDEEYRNFRDWECEREYIRF